MPASRSNRKHPTTPTTASPPETHQVPTSPTADTTGSSLARGRLFVLAAALLWSLSGVFAKGIDLPPLSIALYRSLFAGLALLPLVPRRNRVFRPVMIPCALVFGAMIGMYIAAIKYTTAANAILLQCTATFWLIPLGALFLKEFPDRRALAGIALATLGIAVIVIWGYDRSRPQEGLGVVLALVSGIAYASVVIGLRWLRALDPTWLSVVNNLGGALTLGFWMLLTTGTLPGPGTTTQALQLAAFGTIQMAIPYALFARGLRDIGAAEAGLLGLVEPLVNPLWVYLAHGERPAPATFLGGAMLLGGVVLRYLPFRRRSQPPH